MVTNEPRALTAALQAPPFVTRSGGLAMHAATRHVERWAPESVEGTRRMRPLRNLGFVDRLISPWLESAQRTSPMRAFNHYVTSGKTERAPSPASWVFPRPWFRDELDWMAAARAQARVAPEQGAPTLLTTRGTYIAPAAVPAALHEYIAPSLSVARESSLVRDFQGSSVARPNVALGDAYSPLVPFAASSVAQVIARALTPLAMGEGAAARMSPGLRGVLNAVVERAMPAAQASRVSRAAPDLVTPSLAHPGTAPRASVELAERFAEQRAQLAELGRIAAAERDAASRDAKHEPVQRAPDLENRLAEIARHDAARATAGDAQQGERERIEQRIAQRLGERAAQRQLHESARDAAVRDARRAAHAGVEPAQPPAASVISAAITAAVSALPPELATIVSAQLAQRPERAAHAIAEISDALRAIELIARTSSSSAAIEPTRGPRLVMPTGLGGLVSTVEQTVSPSPGAASARLPVMRDVARSAPATALGAATRSSPAALHHVAWSDRWLARFAGARRPSLDTLAIAAASPEQRRYMLADAAPDSVFVAPAGQTAAVGAALPDQPVVRFADDAETPDDVFAAISKASTRTRAGAAGVVTTPSRSIDAMPARATLADHVAQIAPAAPDAGLAIQLASSPFAPALRHIVPLAAAPSFDVRALLGEGLIATYLAGLISAPTDEVAVADRSWSFGPTYVAPAEEHALTTMRSELLSLDGDASSPRLADSLALPLPAEPASVDGAPSAPSYAAPGMIADRAQQWSVAQARSASDLAFDFVAPELVLAARVYGLGPAEAAQAMRLAIAGPGQLSAMASAIDRTFIDALAIDADRRNQPPRSAYPEDVERSAFAPSSASFGVERRQPRGAFLWPAATSAALGIEAAAPDGEQAISVAALELLAAQAVAELGTYTAVGGFELAGLAPHPAGAEDQAGDATSEDVIDSVEPLVPPQRRDKFKALYLALGQSASGRSWSPAARAARALALAGRGDDAITARERAAVAWDVLPVVFGDERDEEGASSEPLSTGQAAARATRRREQLEELFADSRPGLSRLAARAGEALGSYVSPARSADAHESGRSDETGAVLRPPTAAPELVRPYPRHGGGEVEIPAWFEAAAKKMFESQQGSASDGISIAELTLVTAARPQQIAASSRAAASSGVSAAPAAGSDAGKDGKDTKLDIESIAGEVYSQIIGMIDAVRSRNGEPHL